MNKSRRVVKQSPVRATQYVYSEHFQTVAALESELELDYYNLLNFQRKAEYIQIQPPSIFYTVGGKKRRYTPDFELIEDGNFYVDEVKYVADTLSPEFQRKAYRLSAFFRAQGKIFRVITENDIRVGKRAKNLQYLSPALRLPPPLDDFNRLCNSIQERQLPLIELQKLLVPLGIDASFPRRAIAHQLLKCDLTQAWPSLHVRW